MPFTCCCVPNCSNRGGHLFPKDAELKKKWLIAIKRNMDDNKHQLWTPSKTSVVCKLHFLPTDYKTETSCGTTTLVKRLKKDAVPCIFTWSTSSLSTSSRSKRLRKRNDDKSLKKSAEVVNGEVHNEIEICTSDFTNEIYIAERCSDIEMTEEPNVDSEQRSYVPLSTESCTQTLSWPSLCVEKFVFDTAGMLFYTGLQSYSDFKFVLDTLGDAAYELNYMYYRSDQLTVENQFFLTLIKLRQHKTNFEFSRLFNISETAVVNIWVTWINFMAYQWKEINLWPSQDTVRFFCPSDFKQKFPKTRVIIDGTECPVMKPKLPIAQQSTFSTYKNRNTVKLLVGATPGGLVSYMSPTYGGSTSDRQICERSTGSLTRMCDKGDSIMADKGFNVQDLFAPYDVAINIPTFLSKKNRITNKTVIRDRSISSKRVHIERIIGLAKTFKILKEPLNITETKLASEITFVCFMLCNFRNRIVPYSA